MPGGQAAESGENDAALRVLVGAMRFRAGRPDVIAGVQVDAFDDLDAFEDDDGVTGFVRMLGFDVAGRELDEHVSDAGVSIFIEDLHLHAPAQ
jgi:hypothetical protein